MARSDWCFVSFISDRVLMAFGEFGGRKCSDTTVAICERDGEGLRLVSGKEGTDVRAVRRWIL